MAKNGDGSARVIQRTWLFLKSIVVEVIGLALLLALYGVSLYTKLPAMGGELALFLSAQGASLGHLDLTHGVPASTLLAGVAWLLQHFVSAPLIWARAVSLATGLLAVVLVYGLGSRIFHNTVGAIAAGVTLACWGIFVQSTLANGVMLNVALLVLILLLFFHWFDSAIRSRTLARSMVAQFILLGLALVGVLALGGVSQFLFAVLVMACTLVMNNRLDLIQEVRYPWLFVPMGVAFSIWAVASGVLAGIWPTLVTVFYCQPSLAMMANCAVYVMPMVPLLVPALLEKDILSRALLSHGKALIFLVSWMGWALILGLLFGNQAETFAILAVLPLLIWLGHYLYEVFRNPVIPKPLQMVVDVMIFAGLATSIGLTLLTFQLVPSDLKWPFFLLCCVLPVLSIILALLREFTTSRFLVLSMIPYGLLLCVLAQNTLLPLIQYTPSWRLAPKIEGLAHPNLYPQVVEWQATQNSASITPLILPQTIPVSRVSSLPQLEAALVARSGERFVILPEHVLYQLSWRLRESMFVVQTSWQWKAPCTAWTLLQALQNERLDLETLTEPVTLLYLPAGLE